MKGRLVSAIRSKRNLAIINQPPLFLSTNHTINNMPLFNVRKFQFLNHTETFSRMDSHTSARDTLNMGPYPTNQQVCEQWRVFDHTNAHVDRKYGAFRGGTSPQGMAQ